MAVMSGPYGSHPFDRATDVLVGAIHDRGVVQPNYRGTIDDIRIYNRVLTADELTWLAEN